jgi:hypothetical protein
MGDNSSTNADRITLPEPNDVLLGRGAAANDWIGNQRFRDMIDERRAEYTSHSKFDPKKKIAKEILDKVHAVGGRFLRLIETSEPVDSIIEEGVWEVVGEKVALDKVKQGLREKRPKKQGGTAVQNATSSASGGIHTPTLGLLEMPEAPPLGFNGVGVLPPVLTANNAFPPRILAPPIIGDLRLLLFQNVPFAHLQQQQALAQSMGLPLFGDMAQGQRREPYGSSFAADTLHGQGNHLMSRQMVPTPSASLQKSAAMYQGVTQANIMKQSSGLDQARPGLSCSFCLVNG